MARQLSLLEAPPAWKLDETTREVGRRGVAAARASLEAAIAAHSNDRAGQSSTEHPEHGRSAA